jgi:hypothetical protein
MQVMWNSTSRLYGATPRGLQFLTLGTQLKHEMYCVIYCTQFIAKLRCINPKLLSFVLRLLTHIIKIDKIIQEMDSMIQLEIICLTLLSLDNIWEWSTEENILTFCNVYPVYIWLCLEFDQYDVLSYHDACKYSCYVLWWKKVASGTNRN